MNILAFDAALGRAGVAVVSAGGVALARRFAPGRPGLIETLPELVQSCLAMANVPISAVAVTMGPGSFTGLRTALALAQGYAAAAGVPLWGVSVAGVFEAALPGLNRPLWIAIRARRGKIFLIRNNVAESFADSEIPLIRTPIAVAGNAANEVAAMVAAAGGNVLLTSAREIDPAWVALAAQARRAAGLAPLPAQPIYVDPPEAKLPAGGLRPAPV